VLKIGVGVEGILGGIYWHEKVGEEFPDKSEASGIMILERG
jgi:hypothetical protein